MVATGPDRGPPTHRPPRLDMMYRSPDLLRRRVRVLAAMAVLASVASLGLTDGPATAEPTPSRTDERGSGPAEGACPTAEGITVIIDFQELGGGSYVRCAPGSPSSGFKALEGAGISYRTTTRSPGFLCRIADKPADDPCRMESPTTAYWSYWVAPRGGYWCYSNYGAGNRRPPPGTVEGWSFSLDKTGSNTPPPSIAPPEALPGIPTTQIPGKDCTVPAPDTTTTTTAPFPSTTRPTTGPGPSIPSNPTAPSTPSGPSGPGSAAGPGSLNGSVADHSDHSGPATSTTTNSDDATTSTAPSDESTSTTLGSDAATESDGADPDGSAVEGSGNRGITDADDIAALEGNVELGDDGRSNGSPVPLVVAGVVGTGLVAGGIRQRHRRQAASHPT